ncbi:hypothetical protein JR316_0000642 [Psilocybe cubensis]|uniref:Uncharacterized protein n=2 Tax=Psilocybe cubensis TaxID=181762 RepID=A0ACB8HFY7_PSICU|nr:hypothetical protein JR316_0000642 [Psilocybe cubensis]KAH9486577.1 hypothetical protein JR316_0000642 [Psilocybe cubensis]
MDSQRPRPSILSLFDPLTGSPSSMPDKENNPGDSSFFHPSGFKNARTPVQPTFRRRLIDVGDITIDDPDIQELLTEEDDFERELNCSLAEGDDDNDTLTFRDMVKAATPKWIGTSCHYTSLTTPKSTSSPRTPLAQLPFKDEVTPVARKKPFRRPIHSVASKLAHIDIAETSIEDVLPTTPAKISFEISCSGSKPTSPNGLSPLEAGHGVETLNYSTDALGSSVSTLNLPASTGPFICDISIPQKTPETLAVSTDTLGSSVSTLNLPPPLGASITDISIPISVSPASPRAFTYPSASSPEGSKARLRPGLVSSDTSNRLSIDLQSSFQLHLASTDTTFDLLNEKISFLNFKEGHSFLSNMDLDGSFGDDDFTPAKGNDLKVHEFEKVVVCKNLESNPQSIKGSLTIGEDSPRPEVGLDNTDTFQVLKSETLASERVSIKFSTPGLSSTHQKLLRKSDTYSKDLKERVSEGSPSLSAPNDMKKSSHHQPRDITLLATPSSSSTLQQPPRAVPALKIVKRSKLLVSSQINTTSSTTQIRRTSIVADPPPLASKNPSKSPSTKLMVSRNDSAQNDGLLSIRGLKRISSSQPTKSVPSTSDGPRRIPISGGSKLTSGRTAVSIDPQNSSNNGPRRILVPVAAVSSTAKPLPILASKSAVQSYSGLKQPNKYGTVGSTSSIPKPAPRTASSHLPGRTTNKTRSGLTMPKSTKNV